MARETPPGIAPKRAWRRREFLFELLNSRRWLTCWYGVNGLFGHMGLAWLLAVAHTWIEHAIDNIGDQVEHYRQDGEDERNRHHHRCIGIVDRGNQQCADPIHA